MARVQTFLSQRFAEFHVGAANVEFVNPTTVHVTDTAIAEDFGRVIRGGRGETASPPVVAVDEEAILLTVYSGNFWQDGDVISGSVSGFAHFREGVELARGETEGLDAAELFSLIQGQGNPDLVASLLLSGNDVIEGSAENEDLQGFGLDDTIFAGAGDDTLEGMSGGDWLYGGDGNDLALYSEALETFTISFSDWDNDGIDAGPGFNVTPTRNRDDNGEVVYPRFDKLFEIETLQFGFGEEAQILRVDEFDGLHRLRFSDAEDFIELYIAYFNRAPDALGLNFWGTAHANGTSLEEIASLFIDQDETRTAYPEGVSNTQFATIVFANVLGRVPDTAGLAFWVDVLDDNSVSRDQFILEVLRGARSELDPDQGRDFVDQQLDDRAFLDNKISLGVNYAIVEGLSDVESARAVMAGFNGTQESFDRQTNEILDVLRDTFVFGGQRMHPTNWFEWWADEDYRDYRPPEDPIIPELLGVQSLTTSHSEPVMG